MKKRIVFPYKNYRFNACPIIPIEITFKKTKKIVEAYVDSGAFLSIFSLQEAMRLNIPYEKGRKSFLTVGDGSIIPVYLHLLSVKIGTISFNAHIGFSPRLGVGFNLLGRKDIFRKIDITFSDKDKTVSFIPR